MFSLGRRFDQYVPLVYVLATNKDVLTYTEIMEQLKLKEPLLNPVHIMVDFEQAAIRGVLNEFPQAEVHGCFFHFQQSIWRKIQEVGLRTKYARDPEFALHMRYPAALAFIQPDKVVDSFKQLKKLLSVKKRPAVGSDDHKVRKLFEYLERTWIGNGQTQPLFPIKLWNMWSLTLNKIPRTNNSVEGWHNAINQFVGCHRPSIWTFISKIQKEQNLQELKIAKLLAHEGERQPQRYAKHDSTLFRIVSAYSDDASSFTLPEYFASIANNLSY